MITAHGNIESRKGRQRELHRRDKTLRPARRRRRNDRERRVVRPTEPWSGLQLLSRGGIVAKSYLMRPPGPGAVTQRESKGAPQERLCPWLRKVENRIAQHSHTRVTKVGQSLLCVPILPVPRSATSTAYVSTKRSPFRTAPAMDTRSLRLLSWRPRPVVVP